MLRLNTTKMPNESFDIATSEKQSVETTINVQDLVLVRRIKTSYNHFGPFLVNTLMF